MPIKTEHICDQCGKTIEWNYLSIETTTLKTPAFTYDVYYAPEPKKIFCSMECLAKNHEWFAKRFDATHD